MVAFWSYFHSHCGGIERAYFQRSVARGYLAIILFLAEDANSHLSRSPVMSTIFSKIIRGEADADIVFQDDRLTCFRDIRPAAPVHILIVPNKEIATVNDLADEDEALVGYMFLTAKRLAREQGIHESGYRLIINCNRDGGQEVDHLHLHLVGGRPMGPMVVRR
jgi:histidine triad (HIT) family protein